MHRLRIVEFVPAGSHCHFARTVVRHGTGYGPHRHDFFELFWISDGDGWEDLDGRRVALRPGLVALVAAEDEHGFNADPGRTCRLANLAFPIEAWRALRARCFAAAPDPFAADAPRRLAGTPALARALDAYADELDAGDRSRAALERFLLNLVHALTGAGLIARGSATAPPAWLADAVARVAGDPRRLRAGPHALVALAGRSAEHVAREARRAYGRTPTDLVNDARIAWAARQLAESDASILDVCLECGLSNLGHFYRLFRARLGEPPHRWRARQRGIVGGR